MAIGTVNVAGAQPKALEDLAKNVQDVLNKIGSVAEGETLAGQIESVGKSLDDHISDEDNPHNVTAEGIGAAKEDHDHDGVYATIGHTHDYEVAGATAALINRDTAVNAADANYTTYMARGEALFSAETTPTINGTIAWQYE